MQSRLQEDIVAELVSVGIDKNLAIIYLDAGAKTKKDNSGNIIKTTPVEKGLKLKNGLEKIIQKYHRATREESL